MKQSSAGWLTATLFMLILWLVQRPLLVAVLWTVDNRSGQAHKAVAILFIGLSLLASFVLPRRLDAWLAHGYAVFAITASLYAVWAFPSAGEYPMPNLMRPFVLDVILSAFGVYALLAVRLLASRWRWASPGSNPLGLSKG